MLNISTELLFLKKSQKSQKSRKMNWIEFQDGVPVSLLVSRARYSPGPDLQLRLGQKLR